MGVISFLKEKLVRDCVRSRAKVNKLYRYLVVLLYGDGEEFVTGTSQARISVLFLDIADHRKFAALRTGESLMLSLRLGCSVTKHLRLYSNLMLP